MLIFLILSVIFTEALTEIVVKSYLFSGIRSFFYKKSETNKVFNLVSYLLECGYCFSVWASGITFTLMYLAFKPDYFNVFKAAIFIIIVHRLSNLFHFIIDYVAELRGQGKL